MGLYSGSMSALKAVRQDLAHRYAGWHAMIMWYKADEVSIAFSGGDYVFISYPLSSAADSFG